MKRISSEVNTVICSQKKKVLSYKKRTLLILMKFRKYLKKIKTKKECMIHQAKKFTNNLLT